MVFLSLKKRDPGSRGRLTGAIGSGLGVPVPAQGDAGSVRG